MDMDVGAQLMSYNSFLDFGHTDSITSLKVSTVKKPSHFSFGVDLLITVVLRK